MKPTIACFVVLIYACGGDTVRDKKSEADSTARSTSSDGHTTKTADSIYSIRSRTGLIALQQWDSTFNLEREFGKPLKQNAFQLDERSDTHANSFIKKVQFDGLQFQLFSPPQNGKTFWVQEIVLTNSKYETARGIRVGDSLSKVKEAYPDLQLFPGNTREMYYINTGGNEKSIEFEIPNGKVKKLRLYYMIP